MRLMPYNSALQLGSLVERAISLLWKTLIRKQWSWPRLSVIRVCLCRPLLIGVITAIGTIGLVGCGTMHTPQTEGALKEVAVQAIALVGVPYRYSGNTPDSGFDCSGLIAYVARQTLGINLPRTVKEMSQYGIALSTGDLLPGDLVFFDTSGQTYSHAGIYIGNNRFVHAPSTGGKVRLDSLSAPYWAKRFVAARRLIIN